MAQMDLRVSVDCPYCNKKNVHSATRLKEMTLRRCDYCSKTFAVESSVAVNAVVYSLTPPFPRATDLVKELGGAAKVRNMTKNELVGKLIILVEQYAPMVSDLIDHDALLVAIMQAAAKEAGAEGGQSQ